MADGLSSAWRSVLTNFRPVRHSSGNLLHPFSKALSRGTSCPHSQTQAAFHLLAELGFPSPFLQSTFWRAAYQVSRSSQVNGINPWFRVLPSSTKVKSKRWPVASRMPRALLTPWVTFCLVLLLSDPATWASFYPSNTGPLLALGILHLLNILLETELLWLPPCLYPCFGAPHRGLS